MNKLPTTKQNSNLALKRAKNLLSITDRILNKNSALTKMVFNHKLYIDLGHSDYVESVAITPDGKYIVSGSSDNTIKLWDIKSGEEIRTFKGHSSWVILVTITQDGKYIVSGSLDNTIKLWDIKSGKEIRTFEGHSDSVKSVAITPDGKYIVSGSSDETIKLWDIKSGEEIAQFVSFNDGEWIASTKDGYYNCSKNAYKYFNFQNNKEVITDKNHPIYKQRKKKKFFNINIKPIDLSNAPQTQIDYSTMHPQDNIPDIELDEDEIPY